jgi:hypothetical protein
VCHCRIRLGPTGFDRYDGRAVLLARHAITTWTVVTSFDFDTLVFYRKLAPGQTLGWLVRANVWARCGRTASERAATPSGRCARGATA